MRLLSHLPVLPAYVLLLATSLPALLGSRSLFLRDTFHFHLPAKHTTGEALRAGYLPLVDPHRGGGQPALGNPNTVSYYPDNLLFAVTDPIWALNAHFFLHWLLAPLGGYWLLRTLGLSVEAAWLGGFAFATSGFFLSLFNLYNLIGGVTSLPMLAAAGLNAWDHMRSPERRLRAAAALALLVYLEATAGDPMTAARALLVLVLALAVTRIGDRPRPRAGAGRNRLAKAAALVAAVVLGGVAAWPQLYEFARILEYSYRGFWGFSSTWSLAGSFDPRSAVELLLPLLFGAPDLGFWGSRFFDFNRQMPLVLSLYPGLLVIGLVVAAGLPRRRTGEEPGAATLARPRVLGWLLVAGGGFLVLGRFNPLLRELVEAVGHSGLRFPIKLWPLVALGSSLLAAAGFERAFVRGEPGARRRLLAALGGLLLILGLARAVWTVGAASVEDALERLAVSAAPFVAVAERERQLALFDSSIFVLLGLLVFAAVPLRRPGWRSLALITAHVGGQLLLLRPLLPMESPALYRSPPPIAAWVHPGELVLVADASSLQPFGATAARVRLPDQDMRWALRRGHTMLFPYTGVRLGYGYELNVAPDALDAFVTMAAAQAMPMLDDTSRVRLLRALGVDVVVMSRRLDRDTERTVRLRGRFAVLGSEVFVYQLPGAARPVELAHRVVHAEHLHAALAYMIRADFAPAHDAALDRGSAAWHAPAGAVTLLAAGPVSIRVHTSSAGRSLLVWRRTHLPIYRATIDGEPAAVSIANLTRIGVLVPPGEHEVRIVADRRPLRLTLAGSVLAFLAIGAVALRPQVFLALAGRRGSSENPPRSSPHHEVRP